MLRYVLGYDQASRMWEDNIKMDLTKIGYELVLVKTGCELHEKS
jgi:hypothetical protein